MPLPPPVLKAWSEVALTPEPSVSEAWVLAATPPPGAPRLAKTGPTTAEELWRRLDQTGVTWTAITLRADAEGWETPGALLEGLSRARAMRLAHKLRRWAVLRISSRGHEVLYTGINDKAR